MRFRQVRSLPDRRHQSPSTDARPTWRYPMKRHRLIYALTDVARFLELGMGEGTRPHVAWLRPGPPAEVRNDQGAGEPDAPDADEGVAVDFRRGARCAPRRT